MYSKNKHNSYLESMSNQENYVDKVFYYVIVVFSSIVTIINILFIIPLFKTKTNCFQSNTVLIFQFFLSYIFFNVNVISNVVSYFQTSLNCIFLQTIRYFGTFPSIISALCITLHSYFILTHNPFFFSNKKLAISLFILITWIFAFACSLLYIFVLSDPITQHCTFKKNTYYIMLIVFGLIIDLTTTVICFIILFKICTLNAKNNQELQISKKKTIRKVIIYIFGTLLGGFYKALFMILMEGFKLSVGNYYSIFSCVFNLLMIYIFVWTKQFKEIFLTVYCCKKIENPEDNVDNTRKEEIILDDIHNDKNLDPSEEEM